jgi:superfamily II DNA/RNA helicase
MAFASLGLLPALARAAAATGLHQPTAVQAAAIPAALAGGDVLMLAHTGSGKTAAYLLPALQQLLALGRRAPRLAHTLVLVPTRELAVQVGETLAALTAPLPLKPKAVVVHGGVSINPQMMALRGGADVVVATPGRLLDLVDHNALVLGAVATLVLDEADRLLDEGFAQELQRVVALLPQRRQTLMVSATWPPAVQALAQRLLHAPTRVAPDDDAAGAGADAGGTAPDGALAAGTSPGSPAPTARAGRVLNSALTAAPDIAQRALQVDTARRTALLRQLLQQHPAWQRVLVFVATQHATEHVATKLQAHGVAAAPLHGQLSQGARHAALAGLHSGAVRVVLATDLAARGLHIDGLDAVVNYDLPRAAADHVHRIGRTGRAGASGVAVSFVTAASEAHFRLIEKRQAQRVPREVIAGFEPTETAADLTDGRDPLHDPDGTGGIKGRRPSKKDKLRAAAAASATAGSAPARKRRGD